MASPVPKHLRTEAEISLIPSHLHNHVETLFPVSTVDRRHGIGKHRAKYAPGLISELVKLAGSESLGDPMAGTGTAAYETGKPFALNDIDTGMSQYLEPLKQSGCEISYLPADRIQWSREVCIFSPPYYPRTDRKKPNAHNDEERGPIVGFRDSYSCDHAEFIGNPEGSDGIRIYREQMRSVYSHLHSQCGRMIVVTKNWTRLGVELRLDLDSILMGYESGWVCTARHGWKPKPSLWAHYNQKRGGGVAFEDILVFEAC